MIETVAISNIIVILLISLITYQGFRDFSLRGKFLFSTYQVKYHKEYYRLFTSSFLHADWMHLIFNMFSLYSFGKHIEIYFGPHTFLIIYVSGVLGGNFLSQILHHKHDYRALGASGGVCGIIYASIFLMPGGSVRIFLVPIDIPAYIYAVLFIIFSYIMFRRQSDNIGHDAHLGGAIVGLITATIMYPEHVFISPTLFLIVMLISTGLFIYTYLVPVNSAGNQFVFNRWKNRWKKRQNKDNEKRSQDDLKTFDFLYEKIQRKGFDNLTPDEKKMLKIISDRKRNENK